MSFTLIAPAVYEDAAATGNEIRRVLFDSETHATTRTAINKENVVTTETAEALVGDALEGVTTDEVVEADKPTLVQKLVTAIFPGKVVIAEVVAICEAVKGDETVCGRELPCQYHA